MKAIIFGVNGQDGTYLKELLLLKNIEVIGVSRNGDLNKGDVKDYSFVEALIKHYQPDYIFHFAAVSSTNHIHLFENNGTIGTGTFNILESVRIHCSYAKVFLSGSAMQFKNEGIPIDIDTVFDASSPYSISRIQSVYTGRYYRNHFSLNVYVGYFFNHDSPLRSENHVNQKIVKYIQRLPSNGNEKLDIGNVEIRKEFGFAGDYVDAVWKLINQDIIFEAIIGTGIAFSIEDWLAYCFGKINKNWSDYCFINNKYVKQYDVLISNPEIINKLGWYPSTNFYQLADLMLNNQL